MPHIGRAIYNGLNPFSDETFSDTIASGYRDAMDKARAAASSSKLIDFQFRLTPVAPTGAPAASTTGGGFQSTGGGAPAGETPAEARARANAAKARQDLLDDLSNQILLLRDQYKLETDLIGLGPIRTEQLTKQQQLKEKEAADIQKVREIEGLSAADREAAIARVKELYSTLRSETDSTVSSLVTARQAFEQQGALGQIAIDAELAQREFDQLKQLNSVFNEDLKNILGERFEIENAFYAASEAAKLQFADVNSQEAQDAIAAINAQRDAVLAAFDALSPERLQFAEQQDSFSEGWSQAFGRFREQVTNQADYATRIFDTMSQGFTDSILNFVQTGKLSFKDLFKSLMTEIIKMQANKLFIALFDKGGFFGNLFAGLFNNGGRIPAGKFGIAGERGPEIITGPANVISTNDTAAMMGGGRGSTTINYNINAVDAMSFKQMVARDPEFIYSVTQLGARRLPR
jgi:phage-related minor tail protein